MSNGQQIGGVIGAAVGAVVGYFTGNWKAVQWGYAIGSAVGGYVDPTKNYGPRLEDASTQTSTVGGIIPFGYGVFTCAGNIIWADQLIEHKKSERVGKGGSQKNITYTYTRSYAIGVCEGQIYNYLWIKKNGKLVYSADPAGLGAAMGWTSKQISDLIAASAKFLQETTLYYGTDSQMPDSTIVAVEGVGNVSPFRDLAYIVKENEDLTDMRGAVSQYEFCIRATPPEAYLTSHSYAQYYVDTVDTSARVSLVTLHDALWTGYASEKVSYSPRMAGAYLGLALRVITNDEKIAYAPTLVDGELRSQVKSTNTEEKVSYSPTLVDGELRRQLVIYDEWDEYVTYSPTLVNGELG